MTGPRAKKIQLYISPRGDDTFSGQVPEPDPKGADGPLATLEGARDQVRRLRRKHASLGEVLITLRSGTYQRDQSFSLSAEDSGSKEAPVLYRAADNEAVHLLGGQIIHHFTPVQSAAVLERLCPEARAHVVQCDLRAHGISDLGQMVSRGFSRPTAPAHLELFFAGQRLEVARWPNDDYLHISAPAVPDPKGDDHGGQLGHLEHGFIYDGDRPKTWQPSDQIWLHGYWAWDWANSYERLTAYDSTTGLIKTAPPHGLYGFRAGQRFYFLNVLEELDQPGEYYLDQQSGLLYFWPPADPAANQIVVSLLQDPLIQLKGAEHIHFEGLQLECSRGSGIHIEGGAHIGVTGCTVANIGNHGIVADGGTNHHIDHCHIHHTGDGGLHLVGGNRKTLQRAGHSASDNHIHHMGQWSRSYQPGILLQGVGQRVRHNHIHDGPHNGILIHGNEHLIEFNHVHHVCQQSGDVGALYMGRDWTERGIIIRHNFFHHTQGLGMGSMAIYLDDCASGALIFGNVFYGCSRAVFIGGGRNNRVENNIFVECQPAVQIDGRGLDPRPVWHNMVHQFMKAQLDAVDHHQPPYAQRYPDLRQLDSYYHEGVGIPPEGNLVVRNISVGGQWLEIHWHAEAKMIAIQNNMVDEDPGFVDREGMDFQLRIDSPAYESGFKKLPIAKIGPRAPRRTR